MFNILNSIEQKCYQKQKLLDKINNVSSITLVAQQLWKSHSLREILSISLRELLRLFNTVRTESADTHPLLKP